MALNLLPTLRLALKQLEAASSQAGSESGSEDARPALRRCIEQLEGIEEMDPDTVILNLQEIILNRKGIGVAAYMSVANVRTILRNKGFDNLAEEYTNAHIVNLTLDVRDLNEDENLRNIQESLELLTARDLVEGAGLDWPEDKEA